MFRVEARAGGGWRSGRRGSSLGCAARRRQSSTRMNALHATSRSARTEFSAEPSHSPDPSLRRHVFRREEFRGAQLPGRPQDEAHIPTQCPEAGQTARFPSSDVDQGGPGHPVRPPSQGPPQPVGLIWKIRDRATFEGLRYEGRRVRRGPITVTWLPGDPAEPPRVAYAIGRRAGGAVVRNRVRRRLRAITREERARLRPGAYLIGATAAAASLSYGDLKATVCQALGAMHHRP